MSSRHDDERLELAKRRTHDLSRDENKDRGLGRQCMGMSGSFPINAKWSTKWDTGHQPNTK